MAGAPAALDVCPGAFGCWPTICSGDRPRQSGASRRQRRARREAFVEQVIQTIRTEWDGFTEQINELHVADRVVTATGTYRGTFTVTARV